MHIYHALHLCVTAKHIRIKRQLSLKKTAVPFLSDDKAAISFPSHAEAPEAAAPYDNLHLQTKLEPGL